MPSFTHGIQRLVVFVTGWIPRRRVPCRVVIFVGSCAPPTMWTAITTRLIAKVTCKAQLALNSCCVGLSVLIEDSQS